MIPLFTPAQVRGMDRRTIDGGTGSIDLMERAAGHLARTVLRTAGRSYGLRVALLCGKGNNGGDGFAAARYLARAGAWPLVCLAGAAREGRDAVAQRQRTGEPGSEIELSADAAVQLARWRALGGRTSTDVAAVLDRADIAVDCLLGTGTTGAPRAPYDAAIDMLNRRDVPVVACDLPSGVNADTGDVVAQAVRADVTLTIGAHKRGLALWPARSYAGDVQLADIGIRTADDEPVANLLEPADVTRLLPEPSDDGDKRRRGVVVIVAGSSDMSGAAVLVARGALAAGAGLVTVATTPLARRLVAPNVPEAMTLELPADDPDAAFGRIATLCERADALAIGPGLGHEPPQIALVQRCVRELGLPTVLDADGINAFRHEAKTLADHAAGTLVITPHRSELARVRGMEDDDRWAQRVEWVPECARNWRATIVAKGPGSLIAAPDGRVWVNQTGTAALATGGTGDVLTGMTVAALAAGADPARVAATVTLHGLAGQVAAAGASVRSVTSLDVARAIPRALGRLLEQSSRARAATQSRSVSEPAGGDLQT